MKSTIAVALVASAAMSTFASAQPVAPAEPVIAPMAAPAPVEAAAPQPVEAVLPAGTEILLRLNDQLSSRNNRMGDTFPLTVVHDVSHDGHVVIPANSRAMGQVTWRTGRGSFGKSGKLEITLRYIEHDGRRIPISGFHRQEGEGNTGATIGAVVAAGVIGGLIVHGRTGIIPAGREFTARTVDAIPIVLPGDGPAAASIASSYTPSAIGAELGKRRDERPDRERRGS